MSIFGSSRALVVIAFLSYSALMCIDISERRSRRWKLSKQNEE